MAVPVPVLALAQGMDETSSVPGSVGILPVQKADKLEAYPTLKSDRPEAGRATLSAQAAQAAQAAQSTTLTTLFGTTITFLTDLSWIAF